MSAIKTFKARRMEPYTIVSLAIEEDSAMDKAELEKLIAELRDVVSELEGFLL